MQTTMRFDLGFQPVATPRMRLAVAIVIATVVHVLMLIYLRIGLPSPAFRGPPPAIEIRLRAAQPTADVEIDSGSESGTTRMVRPAESPPSKPVEPVAGMVLQQDVQADAAAPENPKAPIAWQELTKQAAREVVAADAEQEAHREELWRRTHSIMFAPAPNTLIEQQPVLPDLVFDDRRFKGLGFRIGNNCYFGIPAAPPDDVDSDATGPRPVGAPRPRPRLLRCSF